MKIIKIGGSILSNLKNIKEFSETVKPSQEPILLVVSAFDKLSSSLKNFANNFNKFSGDSLPIDFFNDFTKLLNPKIAKEFNITLELYQLILKERMMGIQITQEIPPLILDEILSMGEYLSSYYLHCLLLNNRIDNNFIDARDLIRTNSEYGNAKPDLTKSINLIKFNINKSANYVSQGFIASDDNGRTTTMGFESSNLSAILFAMALDSKKIEIITKVNQIYTFDPHIYNNARQVESIPYQSAKLLANNHFKMLFPGMIDIAQKNNIEIVYKGISNGGGTLISENEDYNLPVILPTDEGVIITPINKKNATDIVNKFEDNLIEYHYNTLNNSLILKLGKNQTEEIHNFTINLF